MTLGDKKMITVKRFGSEYPEVEGNVRQIKIGEWICMSKQILYNTSPEGKPLKLFWKVRVFNTTFWL